MSPDRSPTSDRETARIVRSWLSEGTTRLPDRVLDAVLDEVPSTPQRRAWWPAWRFADMNNTLRIALAAVAVVAIAFVGLSLLPRSNDVGGATQSSSPSAAPTETATPTPSPTAALRLPPEGTALSPGRYTAEVPDVPVSVTFTIGDGWTSGGWYLMNPPRPGQHSAGFTKSMSLWTVDNVYADVCDLGSLPDPAIGPTVDDLVSALDAQTNTEMSSVVDVVVGGAAGKRLVMTRPSDIDCGDGVHHPWWVESSGDPESSRWVDPGQQDTVWIVDVDGHRVVIAEFVVDLVDIEASRSIDAIIDSMEFDVH